MAVTEPIDRIDEFLNNYEKITLKMLGETSFQKKMIDNIVKIFDDAGISTEQKGIALTELASQTAIQYNKDAISASLDVIKLAPEFELKAVQRDLTLRQIQGYDDNMLIKVSEQQSNLASFAVNANSDSAQSTINELKAKMASIAERVKPIDGSTIVTVPVTPPPTGLVATVVTDTSITIEWNAVVGATQYLVYVDGLLSSTQGSLSFTLSGLTESTKYSFALKASIDGVESDYTSALVTSTIATP